MRCDSRRNGGKRRYAYNRISLGAKRALTFRGKSFVNETLPALESKWEGSLYVLDLFNGTYIDSPKYMQEDGLHPTKEGYSQMFTAQFISFLTEILK